jgi:hypothetical protein
MSEESKSDGDVEEQELLPGQQGIARVHEREGQGMHGWGDLPEI